MVFKDLCVLVLCTKVASALGGLIYSNLANCKWKLSVLGIDAIDPMGHKDLTWLFISVNVLE